MVPKLLTIAGACLIIVGIGGGYVDVATRFRFDFISRYFYLFLLALIAGVALSFVGLIGWAKRANARGRSRMAATVFAFPLALAALGYPIDGADIHGPFGLVFVLTLPACILALVLLSIGRH